MDIFVNEEIAKKIEFAIFEGFGNSLAEVFLMKELRRYVPQFLKADAEEIREFVKYQRSIYIKGIVPAIGRPIASLNPTFIDSTDSIKFSVGNSRIYTRASLKENGYRIQLHNRIHGREAFTRQFTRYDLRMFPELNETLKVLPVMIGDAELVSRWHTHLAGFNRVQKRIPNTLYWPKKGKSRLEKKLIDSYLSNRTFFKYGKLMDDFELTLSFHGLFAISHPDTWHQSRKKQLSQLISLCKLPIDYELIDMFLNQLAVFIKDTSINARVVERVIVKNKEELDSYVKQKEDASLEGTCVSQSSYDKKDKTTFAVGKSFKIKNYETIDMALMGIYFKNKDGGLTEENIKGCLLGLFDYNTFGEFLPSLKVNLNPEGPQIKTDGQRERLTTIRREIVESAKGKVLPNGDVPRLYDAFLKHGEIMLERALNGATSQLSIKDMVGDLPRGKDLMILFKMYEDDLEYYRNGIKKPNASNRFIIKYSGLFDEMFGLVPTNLNRILRYFSKSSEIKKVSARFVRPSVIIDTSKPIIIEARIFDIKWGLCPYPSGFHTWYANSFHFTNAFAECIRYDKSTCTDYETIFELARAYTVKKSRKK